MKKERKKSNMGVEITAQGDTSITGDVVGRDKFTSEVTVNVTLNRQEKKQSGKKTKNSNRNKRMLSRKLIEYYFILLGGVGTIVVGVLLFLGIVTLKTTLELLSLSGTAGQTLTATAGPNSLQYQASLQPAVTVTLTSSACDAKVEVVNEAGDVLVTMVVLSNTVQTINLPSGSYRYNVEYKCTGGLGGAAGLVPPPYSSDFALDSKGNISIVLPSPESDFTFEKIIGIVSLIIGVIFLLVLSRIEYPTWRHIGLLSWQKMMIREIKSASLSPEERKNLAKQINLIRINVEEDENRNLDRLDELINDLAGMNKKIFEVAIATLADPLADIGLTLKKMVKVRPEVQSK